jgi:hypothetical protein
MPTELPNAVAAAAGTVRVNCMVNEFTPGDAAGLNFRLMVWSVDAIG